MERQRAEVDITAVIHLADSLPNTPLGETQICVTTNAANAHTFAYKCVHTQRKYVFMIPYFVVYAHTHSSILFWVNGKSLHTPLHCSLCKHKPETLSSVQISTLLSTSILPLTCTHVKICMLKMQ